MGSIYEFKCLVNGKKYHGLTKQDPPEKRIYEHKRNAENGIKGKFYNAIRKHGWNNFTWRWLHRKTIPLDQLKSVEIFYIWYYNSRESGYNVSKGGQTSPMENPEIKEKVSKLNKEKWQDPEYVQKVLEAINTPEYKENQSRTSKENWKDPEVRRRRVDGHKNPESIAKRKANHDKKLLDRRKHIFQFYSDNVGKMTKKEIAKRLDINSLEMLHYHRQQDWWKQMEKRMDK